MPRGWGYVTGLRSWLIDTTRQMLVGRIAGYEDVVHNYDTPASLRLIVQVCNV